MRAAGPIRALGALAVSIGVHGAIFAGFAPGDDPAMVAGGAAVEVAALGNSFEDMVAAGGVLQPVPGEVEAARPVSETARRIEPDAAERPVEVRAMTPQGREAVRPTPVETARDAAVKTATPLDAATLAEPVGAEASPAPAPTLTAALDEATATGRGEISEAAPVLPLAAAPVPRERPLEARDQATQVPTATARIAPRRQEAVQPMMKPDSAEAIEAETAKAQPVVTASLDRPKPRRDRPRQVLSQGPGPGRADRDAIRGSADGRRQARTGISATGERRTAALPGNAAASNYPGEVYARIRRTRQRHASGHGVVRVRFTIRSNGELASVSLATGSGSDSVDRVALDHVRRSAPFPPPPPGARTRFIIPIEVR